MMHLCLLICLIQHAVLLEMLVPSASFSTLSCLAAAGAGAIISAGLMRMLSFEEVEDFITSRTRYPPAGQVGAQPFCTAA